MTATKVNGNTTDILKCTETQSTIQSASFQNKFTLWYIKLNMYICIYSVSYSLEMQRRFKQTKVYYNVFSLCLKKKKTSHKPLKVAFKTFILYNNWKILFFYISLSSPRGVLQPSFCYVL